MSSKRKHRGGGHDEEHENAERWLVTYADMLTLLMVLFIVMFAMSTVDANKFSQLKESLAGAFGGTPSLVSGGSNAGGGTDGASAAPMDIAGATGGGSGVPEGGTNNAVEDLEAVQKADRAKASRTQNAAKAEVDRLEKLRDQMIKALKEGHLEGQVQFAIDQRGLVVRVLTSGVVFGGDSAALRPEGQRILRALVPALDSVPNALEISGHTNQLKVATRNYPSSWELSTARASSVVRYLLQFRGLNANRMTAAGYADQRPLYSPADPRAVTMNRRVEVVVLSNETAEVKALLPTVARGK
ncbi:OmpA/MotB family protein [Actinophytocola xanthii]|uniref:Flagellar motor protein MotB n=1 Tax=Actinophytocola xanthii TaxID=1912961 RepID=A0A1Q8BXR5_9PSEU|nr:flagellar motor protein MotB [Actinophytocola xanthii]OLF06907.1 flagellar motor protein MotB [Actinophytocola xanthii]